MILKVKKRDGREKPFNIEKIAGAIAKAIRASGELDERLKDDEQQLSLIKTNPEDALESTSLNLAIAVVNHIESQGQQQPGIEDIQDAVEHVLVEQGFLETAKRYILYRAERSRIRELNTRLMRTLHDITFSMGNM